MKYQRGYTLIELMVAITIVAILLGIGVPSFREFTRSNRITAAQNDLVTSLNLARSEALRRNRPVSVCASTDGTACGVDTDWISGWMAFTDRGAVGTVDADDEVIQFWPGPSNSTVEMDSGGAAFVRYAATGMVVAPITIDVSWPGCTGANLRRVTVMASGSIVGQKVAC
jgi:type IV fimbrial biogenesis protein FimT